MEIVFHFGTCSLQNSMRSETRRRLGSTGKMYVPRATYSFRMSFWTVPRSSVLGTPCSSATAT
jgi:hypothetical protein